MFNSVNDKMDEAQQDASEDNYILATVTNNQDPLGLNRIQVSAPKLFDPQEGEQPWIGAHAYSPFGQGPNYGVYGSPWIGSKVKVKLQQGDVNQGFYEAVAYVKADANSKFADPKTWGYRDPSGNELYVNMGTGEWTFTHSSGVKESFDGQGNRTIAVPGNMDSTVQGNLNFVVSGNVNIQATGSVTVQGTSINLN